MDVLYDGKPVLDWFRKLLATQHKDHYSTERIVVCLTFDQPRSLEIKGETYGAVGLTFEGHRKELLKRKTVELFGDAVYDWQKEKYTIPPGGRVFSSAFSGTFDDFEEFAGPVPDKTDAMLEFAFCVRKEQFDPNMDVVDLMSL
jgi:hypothetical protein